MGQIYAVLFRRDRALALLAAGAIVALMVGAATLSLTRTPFALAAAPTGTSASLEDNSATHIRIQINGTDFDTFVSSGTATADATDRANITYAGANPTFATVVSATRIDASFLISAVGTAKSGGSLTMAASTVQDSGSVDNALITIVDGSVTDNARPIVSAVALSSAGSRNRLSFTYSETVTVTNGASTATKGDTTAAGTVAGFGSFATAGNVTVATAKNTVAGSGSTTLTIDLADQAAAFLAGTSTTEPSGAFTPSASAEIVDANSNQANPINTPTATGGGSWDLTKPTITSVTVDDAAGNNGKIDQAIVVFNSAVRDANITNGDAALGASGTTTGTFTTGTANDATTTFNRTADDNGVDTSTAAGNFTYSAATTSITDLAGNLLDTATDGQIATGDIAETDGAEPILTAVAKSSSGSRNRLSFTYSENIVVTNGASTATKGDVTTAGTVECFGSFATAGNVTVPTTLNTVGGNGTSTLTVDLADQPAGYMNASSTTEPSGVFTPVACATVADAASNQVNASAAAPTATGGGTWDLTKPTISSVAIADATDDNGKVDQATVTFDSAVRDANITDGDGSLAGAAGAFTTGTADDDTTTFDRTLDTAAVDTSATAAQFNYSGATTFITDLAGNLLNTATDGTIADGDVVETDGAEPILTSVTLAYSGGKNRVTFGYSENITLAGGDGASTTLVGNITTAGTVAGFGSFDTAGDATVQTTMNSVSGSGTSSILVILAGETGGLISTVSDPGTEPSGPFSSTSVGSVKDSASNSVNSSAADVAPTGGGSWDLTDPTAPAVANLQAGSDSGASDADDVTNETTPTFDIGSIETGAAVNLISDVDGTIGTGTETANASTITSSVLTGGDAGTAHDITSTQVDTAGNESVASAALSVTIDTGVAAAPGVPDLTAGTDTGSSDTDDLTNDTTPDFDIVAGETGSTINLISDVDGAQGSAAESGGTATITAGGLTGSATGTVHSITATETDLAGNVSGSSAGLSVTVDNAAPEITAAEMQDTDDDGTLDEIVLTLDEVLDDSVSGTNGFDATSLADHGSCTGEDADPDGTTTLSVVFACTVAYTAVGDLTLDLVANAGVADAAGNQVATVTLDSGSVPAITDGAAPVIVSSTPADGATGVSRTADFTFTFSEPMDEATTEAAFSLTPAAGVNAFSWDGTSETLTVNPASTLAANTAYDIDFGGPAESAALGDPDMDAVTIGFTTASSGGGGGGGGSTTAPSTTPTLDLTAPSGTVTAGSAASVIWTVGGSGISNMELRYSADGGISTTLIATGLDKTLPYSWLIPASLQGNVILYAKGRDSGGAYLATDQATLTVAPASAEPPPAALSDGNLPTLSTLTDEQAGITRNEEGRRVAPDSGTAGPSPVSGVLEPISVVRPGQLVRGNSYPTIYLVTDDLKRHPLWDATTYFTWTDSWDRVVWVTDATLATLPLSSPLLPKPGVVLVKIQSDSNVYAVDANDGITYQLRWVPTEDIAVNLYGGAWADYVIDVEPTTLARYDDGADMTSSVVVNRSIMKTRAQLAALVAGTVQSTAVVRPPTAECTLSVRIDRSLGTGSSGTDVLAMQELLRCLGSFPTSVAPNGNYGPTTEAAVKDFQADNGLDTLGLVGPATRDALNAYLGT